MSLCASGTPCSGPTGAPPRWRLSAASAAARAPSPSTSTKQLSVPPSRAMRSRQASVTSRAVVVPAAIASAVSVSDALDQSVIFWLGGDVQQGGAEVEGIDVEVDFRVRRFDRAAQLLELDRQFFDTCRFELKLCVTFVHRAYKVALDHFPVLPAAFTSARPVSPPPPRRPLPASCARPWAGRDRHRPAAGAAGWDSGSASRCRPCRAPPSARPDALYVQHRDATPARPIAARAAGRGPGCRRACRRSARPAGGDARSRHRGGAVWRAGRPPALRRAAN